MVATVKPGTQLYALDLDEKPPQPFEPGDIYTVVSVDQAIPPAPAPPQFLRITVLVPQPEPGPPNAP